MKRPQAILLARVLIMNFFAPMAIFTISRPITTLLMAILLSGIPVFVDGIIYMVHQRKFDAVNVCMMAATLVGALFAILSDEPKILLLKDNIVTIFFGVMFLSSFLHKGENQCFAFYRQFSCQSREQQKKIDEHYKHPIILKHTKIMTHVFGWGYVIEGLLRIILLYTIPVEIMAYISTYAPFVTSFFLCTWCYFYVKYMWALVDDFEEEVSIGKIDVEKIQKGDF